MRKREKSQFEKTMKRIKFFMWNVVRPMINILTNISENYSKMKDK